MWLNLYRETSDMRSENKMKHELLEDISGTKF